MKQEKIEGRGRKNGKKEDKKGEGNKDTRTVLRKALEDERH